MYQKFGYLKADGVVRPRQDEVFRNHETSAEEGREQGRKRREKGEKEKKRSDRHLSFCTDRTDIQVLSPTQEVLPIGRP